jgi:hypothetical protein
MRRTLALLSIVALAYPTVAFAEGEAAAGAPAATGRNKSPPISEEAKRHFQAGVTLLQDPEGERVEDAYREFKTAYDISGSPKILGNIGFCAMRLERDSEAIEAYSTYLREVSDIDPEERAQITRDLQTLAVGVVRLTLEVDKPGVQIVDERVPVRGVPVTNAYGPVDKGTIDVGVRPGHHVFRAKLAGHEDAVWEIEAYAASREKHAFRMKPIVVTAEGAGSDARKSTNIVPWVVAGTGAAMLIAGTVTGVVALGKTNDIEKACPNDQCPKGYDLGGERSSTRTFVRLTDVLLVGGGVLVLGGVTWGLLSSRGGDERGTARRAAPRADVACGPSGCAATLTGAF